MPVGYPKMTDLDARAARICGAQKSHRGALITVR
jgi:hypothetical protein